MQQIKKLKNKKLIIVAHRIFLSKEDSSNRNMRDLSVEVFCFYVLILVLKNEKR